MTPSILAISITGNTLNQYVIRRVSKVVDRANAAKRRAAADTSRAWRSDWAKWLSFCNSGCLVFPEYERLCPDHHRRRPIPADPWCGTSLPMTPNPYYK
jgi:hypothetical protein